MTIPLAQVQAIAVKAATSGPMREVAVATVEVGGGIIGGEKPSAKRGVTFISSAQWAEVMRLLGSDKPWHTRRANVLVDATRLDLWLGKTVRVGTALIRIHAETRPCELMNELLPGLLEALKPECRAGVYGEVLEAGQFAVGDAVTRVD